LGPLLHPASLKEALVGGVLPDVGGVALLSGVDLRVRRCLVLRDFGLITGAFWASVGGRHGRHVIVAGHLGSLSGMRRWTEAVVNDLSAALVPSATPLCAGQRLGSGKFIDFEDEQFLAGAVAIEPELL
jgi:hypothetical protein